MALADKLDTLAGFFAIGERPGGSGDPYALRRAALGVIRIVREQPAAARPGGRAVADAVAGYSRRPGCPDPAATLAALAGFIAERLRVQLRARVPATTCWRRCPRPGRGRLGPRRACSTAPDAVAGLLGTEDGRNLLVAASRAANILRIEDRKDGPHDAPPQPALLAQDEERALAAALEEADAADRRRAGGRSATSAR